MVLGLSPRSALVEDHSHPDDDHTRLMAEVADQRRLLDRLPIATAVKNRDGRVLYANAAASAGYGLTPEAMIGRCEHELLPRGNDADEVLRHDREVIESGRSLSVPGQRFVTSEGREMTLHMTREPVRYQGQACVLVNAHDVTEQRAAAAERRKLERRMAESQRLEGLGLMAGGIAHDFNNLLVGVLANAEMALRNVEDPNVATGFIERIKVAAERLAGFARQMLAYSGRDHVRIGPVDLPALTREALGLVGPNVSPKIRIERDLPLPAPPSLQVSHRGAHRDAVGPDVERAVPPVAAD